MGGPNAGSSAQAPKPGALYREGPSGRFLLDGKWYGRPDPQDNGIQQGLPAQTATSGWSATRIPEASNAGDFSVESYTGQVHWYRKDFKLPPGGTPGDQYVLRFESVNYRAKVWLNGKPIGFNVGGYLPFELRAKRIKEGVNRLVVRVDSKRKRFDIPPLSQRESGLFEGGWWNYNGILREVYLRRVESLDAEEVFAEPTVKCRKPSACRATVSVQVKVRNHQRRGRRASVTGTFGDQSLNFKRARRVAGRGFQVFRSRIKVRSPRLWTPEHPNLYRLNLDLQDGGSVVQTYNAYPGLRSWRVSGLGRIQLNGRDVNLRGASIHEDNFRTGAALSHGHIDRLFTYLKQVGANMTRSHYPLNPYALELADRKGIVMWSEIPVYRMSSSLFNSPTIVAKALRMLRTEIVRDFNHPSIAVWSLGNELPSRPKLGQRNFITRADRMAEEVDPSRLTGIAISGYPTVGKQSIYLKLNVIGVNDYFGWYDGPRGTIADPAGLSGYLNRLHSDYPNQAFVITEFGAEANRDGQPTEKGTYQFQQNFLKYHLDVFSSKPFVNGALVWNLTDFRVKPFWDGGNPQPNPPINQKGLIDDYGHFKPSFFTVKQEFEKTPLYGRQVCC